MLITNYAPNQRSISFTLDGTWQLVTGFPGLDAGMRYQSATVRTVDSTAVANGSGFTFRLNLASAPTTGKFVSGSGQTEVLPGGGVNMWVKGTSTDILQIEVYY